MHPASTCCFSGLLQADYTSNPNRSSGRKKHLFIASCFYKASVACFQLKIARYYSQKKQATDALIKNQNPINPNKRFGFKGE